MNSSRGLDTARSITAFAEKDIHTQRPTVPLGLDVTVPDAPATAAARNPLHVPATVGVNVEVTLGASVGMKLGVDDGAAVGARVGAAVVGAADVTEM